MDTPPPLLKAGPGLESRRLMPFGCFFLLEYDIAYDSVFVHFGENQSSCQLSTQNYQDLGCNETTFLACA
jgi:hypothetical protein